MSGILEVSTDLSNDSAVVVNAAGEVDMSSAPLLHAELARACDTVTEPAAVVADLTRVEFFASSGVAVLAEIQERCRAQRTPLRVVPGHTVRRTLELCGVDQRLDIRESLASATWIDA